MNVMRRKKNACDLWNVAGDFGEFSGEVVFDGNGFYVDNQKIRISSRIEKYENGVVLRKGKIKNVSEFPVTLTTLSSKFSLDGGEYEIYTQYNGWQNESSGGWQSLVTSVSVRSPSVRNAFEASPFMAVWNMQTSRGVAFHLNAYSKWEMRISRCYAGEEASYAEVELGIMPEDFSYILGSGEEIELPEEGTPEETAEALDVSETIEWGDGDFVTVYYNGMLTRSEPAQLTALEVVVQR